MFVNIIQQKQLVDEITVSGCFTVSVSIPNNFYTTHLKLLSIIKLARFMLLVSYEQ